MHGGHEYTVSGAGLVHQQVQRVVRVIAGTLLDRCVMVVVTVLMRVGIAHIRM